MADCFENDFLCSVSGRSGVFLVLVDRGDKKMLFLRRQKRCDKRDKTQLWILAKRTATENWEGLQTVCTFRRNPLINDPRL